MSTVKTYSVDSGDATNLTLKTNGTTALTVDGTTQAVTISGSQTVGSNLTFTGTGNRITGDFTNATIANRVMFQTSSANTATSLGVIPNGTSNQSQISLESDSAATNGINLQMIVLASEARFSTGIRGSGTYAPMTFYTGGSERMRIVGGTGSDVGYVGIGTASPSSLLNVVSNTNAQSWVGLRNNNTGSSASTGVLFGNDGNAAYGAVYLNSSTNSGLGAANGMVAGTYGAYPIAFITSSTERMRIDSSGKVGIGTSSPSVYAKLHVVGTTWLVSGGATTAALTVPQGFLNGDISSGNFTIGNFGDSSSEMRVATRGFTSFYTGAFDNATGTERARIDSSGRLLVGVTSASSGGKVSIQQNDNSNDNSYSGLDIYKGSATTSTAQVFQRFFISNGTANGSITANGASNAAFTAYSDARLKENIVNLPAQLANILALRPVEFDYKGYENGEGHQIGFIAQEMQGVYPDVVNEGENGMLTVTGWSKTEARLVAAIQEQQAIIEQLKADVAALKGKV